MKDGRFAIAANLSIGFRPSGRPGTMETTRGGWLKVTWTIECESSMVGIGAQELIILLVIGVCTVVPGVIGIGVLIWLIVRSSGKRRPDE